MNPTHNFIPKYPFNSCAFKNYLSERVSVKTDLENAKFRQIAAVHLINNPFHYEPDSCAKQLALAYLHSTRVCFAAYSKKYSREETYGDLNRVKEILFISDKELTERKVSLPGFNQINVDANATPLRYTEVCTYQHIWSLYNTIRFQEAEGNFANNDTFSCESLLSAFHQKTPDSRKEIDKMFWSEVSQARGAWVEMDKDYSPEPISNQSVSYPMFGPDVSNPELLSYLDDSIPKQLIEKYDAKKVSDWSIEIVTERPNELGQRYRRTVYVNKEPHNPEALHLRTSQQVSNKNFHWYVLSELYFQDTRDLDEAVASPVKLNEMMRQKYDWALRTCFKANDVQWGDV